MLSTTLPKGGPLRRLSLALSCSAVAAICGCKSPPEQGSLQGMVPLAAKPMETADLHLAPGDLPASITKLRFGITPYLAARQLHVQMQPVADEVGAALGIGIEVTVTQTYGELVDAMARGTMDIALLSPLTYVLAKERQPDLQLLARTMTYGSTDYSSYLAVRADSSLQGLSDLKGKRIAFVDPLSASGFLFPYVAILDGGLDPKKDFQHLEFSGTHPASLQAVASGRVDAAAISSGTLTEDQSGASAEVRILFKAGRVPYDALCARAGLSPAVIAKLSTVFQHIDTRSRRGREILGRATGISAWIAAQDRDYDDVRAVLSRVRHHDPTILPLAHSATEAGR